MMHRYGREKKKPTRHEEMLDGNENLQSNRRNNCRAPNVPPKVGPSNVGPPYVSSRSTMGKEFPSQRGIYYSDVRSRSMAYTRKGPEANLARGMSDANWRAPGKVPCSHLRHLPSLQPMQQPPRFVLLRSNPGTGASSFLQTITESPVKFQKKKQPGLDPMGNSHHLESTKVPLFTAEGTNCFSRNPQETSFTSTKMADWFNSGYLSSTLFIHRGCNWELVKFEI